MSTATGPAAWNAMVLDVHKELALEAGVIYEEYACHKAFLAASKAVGIVRSDAMQEASRRKAAAAGKKSGVEERAEKYRAKAEEEELNGVAMREAPSTYAERAIHRLRLEIRGLPLVKQAKAVPVPKAEPKEAVPVPKAEPKEAKAVAKAVPKAEAKAVAKAEAKEPDTPAPSPVTTPLPKVPEPEDSEERRRFLAEGYDEIVVGGNTYYRIVETGDCFAPGELPYSIGEHMGVWDADLGELVK